MTNKEIHELRGLHWHEPSAYVAGWRGNDTVMYNPDYLGNIADAMALWIELPTDIQAINMDGVFDNNNLAEICEDICVVFEVYKSWKERQ